MQDQPFITRPMSVLLDALRFGCALMVVVCHASGENVASAWPFSFSARFPHNCVVVFFVLSGLVISAAVTNRQTDLKSYAIARAARIFSVAIPAVFLSSMVVLAAQYSSGTMSAAGVGDLLAADAMGLAFLSQGPFGSGVPGNQPYWSLCYEVWYYALFGAWVFLAGARRWIAMAICAVLAGWQILLLWPVWLMGVWLHRSAFLRSISFGAALPILLACEIALLQVMTWDFAALASLRDIFPFGFGMSEWVVSDFAVGMIVVFALAAARPIAERFAHGLERIAGAVKYAAGFSFTLYLFHAPVGAILIALGLHPHASPFHVIACVALIVLVCAIIAHFTERRAPALRRSLEKLFGRNRRSPSEFASPVSPRAPA